MTTTTRKRPARKSSKPRSPRMDVYEAVTAQVIELLEAGTVPWHRPWDRVAGPAGLPMRMSSKTPYRGMNVFLLEMAAMAKGYNSPWWGTYDQIAERGGQVRKGETGTLVFFWSKIMVDDRDNPGEKKSIFFAKSYKVFNADQADGLGDKFPKPEPRPELERIAECEQALKGYLANGGPDMVWGGNRACYSPSADQVRMPERGQFHSAAELYGTWFHELVHSTGHADRLKRPNLMENHGFGSPSYSQEELVAEMGAAFLAGVTGIAAQTLPNSAAYLASWLKELKNDPKMLIRAAAQAQKAVDLIMGVEHAERTD